MSEDSYELNKNTYNSLAKQYEEKFMDWDGYQATYDRFLESLAPNKADILEIGCGPGNVTRYLLRKNPKLKIHGIDNAPNMIALAEQNNPQASYEVMDCRAINSFERKFDAIMCGFCIPYITKEDTLILINHTYALLETGGVFYLSTMEDDNDQSGVKGSPNHDLKVFIHYHQAQYLKEALVRNGFELIDEIRQDYAEHDGSTTTDLFLIARKK